MFHVDAKNDIVPIILMVSELAGCLVEFQCVTQDDDAGECK